MCAEKENKFPLARETPIEVYANGKRLAILMCTAENLQDLAVGHLVARGMLADPTRVLTIGACEDLRTVSVTAPDAILEDSYGLGVVISSGCGSQGPCRTDLDLPWVPGGFSVKMADLKSLSAQMFKEAVMYRETGGMHCASLISFDEQGVAGFSCIREDVGRHNAVDKVVGCAFMRGVDFSRSVILTSGRIAADMILKAVATRLPVLVSRSIPTTTAYELAKKCNITLIGRIEKPEPVLYTCPGRISV